MNLTDNETRSYVHVVVPVFLAFSIAPESSRTREPLSIPYLITGTPPLLVIDWPPSR